MEELELYGELSEDYTLSIAHSSNQSFRRILSKFLGKELVIIIKPIKYLRTAAQNRWLWGVCYPTIRAFEKESGRQIPSKDELHVFHLTTFLGVKPVVKEVLGMEVVVMEGKTSSQLSKAEWNTFKEDIQQHWAEKGCDIPDPKKNNFLQDFIEDDEHRQQAELREQTKASETSGREGSRNRLFSITKDL
jgi:hypothetical protein